MNVRRRDERDPLRVGGDGFLSGWLRLLVTPVAVGPPFAGEAFDHHAQLRDRDFIQLANSLRFALALVAASLADGERQTNEWGQSMPKEH